MDNKLWYEIDFGSILSNATDKINLPRILDDIHYKVNFVCKQSRLVGKK